MKKYDNESLEWMIKFIDQSSLQLNDFETNFLNTVRPRINACIPISEKQISCLKKIFDKVN